ncbi:MAG: VWA domain-containing protein [Blastocatellia bacterium]
MLLCLSAVAQTNQAQQSKSQDALRIETELVQIDLVVTDKQGNPVSGLKREDFELFDDGKKQTLTHFAVGTSKQPARWITAEKKQPANSSKPVEAKTDAANETAGRFIVLAVDDYHLSPANLIYVKRTLSKFVAEQMVAGDQIAVVTTSGNVGLFQQFTNEREVLERAINRLRSQERSATDIYGIPPITEYQAELIEYGNRDAMDLAISDIMRVEPPPPPPGGAGQQQDQAASQNIPSPREILEYRVRTKAKLIMSMAGNYTRATLDTLESVIRGLRPLPGRKLMVVLSDGFLLGGGGLSSTVFDLRRITDAATRAGVVIYSIDSRGLVTLTPGGDASERVELDPVHLEGARSRLRMATINAKRDGLFALAEETGGKLFYNSNDLNLGLQRVLDTNETYYVLAYEPQESRRNGSFHKIEIRVPGRPELKVRTRNGYYAPDDAMAKAIKKAEEKRQENLKKMSLEKREQELKAEKGKVMAKALGSLIPLRDVPIETVVNFVDLQNFSGVLLNTHINAADLSFEENKGRHQTVIELSGYVFDENGETAASFSELININALPETMNQIVQLGFNHRRLMELKPGFYQVRMAVREEKTGRLGSHSGWVEIPDLTNKRLTLSGIFLTRPGNNALQNLTNDQLTPPANQPVNQTEGYTPRPSVSRRFKAGSDVDLLLFAYNAKTESNTANTVDLVTQTHVFSGSKLVFASPVVKMAVAPDSDMQRIPYAARIPLKGFAPGQYELRVTVIDRMTKATANRRVNFTVE